MPSIIISEMIGDEIPLSFLGFKEWIIGKYIGLPLTENTQRLIEHDTKWFVRKLIVNGFLDKKLEDDLARFLLSITVLE